jgi:hypothetical protein
MRLPSHARMNRYCQRVHVRSGSGGQSGYFRGCITYFDNGHLTVLLRHRCNTRLRRPFPLVTLEQNRTGGGIRHLPEPAERSTR